MHLYVYVCVLMDGIWHHRQSLLISLPGAEAQQWHIDGDHLTKVPLPQLPQLEPKSHLTLPYTTPTPTPIPTPNSCSNPKIRHQRAHAVNVFIALGDISVDMGPTEMRPASHFISRKLSSMMLLARARSHRNPGLNLK